jgi:hypothetical protein
VKSAHTRCVLSFPLHPGDVSLTHSPVIRHGIDAPRAWTAPGSAKEAPVSSIDFLDGIDMRLRGSAGHHAAVLLQPVFRKGVTALPTAPCTCLQQKQRLKDRLKASSAFTDSGSASTGARADTGCERGSNQSCGAFPNTCPCSRPDDGSNSTMYPYYCVRCRFQHN